jgi:pilus assembly protein Flp/PilA
MLQYISSMVVVALQDRKGITAMEYGILAAAILGAVATAATTIGTDLTALFAKIIADIA